MLPVVEGLAAAGERVSIDTTKPSVARAALAAGATIVNDVSAFRFEPELAGLVADAGAGCCLVHMRGEPRTMQRDPRYDDVVSEVSAFLEERLAFAVAEGVAEERIWLDPGHRLRQDAGAQPRAAAPARRDRRHRPAGRDRAPRARASSASSPGGREAGERLPGTIATNVMALERGASVFRVHDVRPVVDALAVAAATVRP